MVCNSSKEGIEMNRFFIKKENIKDKIAIIEGEDVSHIANVLRKKKNDRIVLCNGEGSDYIVLIESIENKIISTKILYEEKSIGETYIDITVYQGLPKSSKMELIIQKSTELGANRIVPMISDRSIVRFNSAKDEAKKIERWQKIATEAAKQSGRGSIPYVSKPMIFEKALDDAKSKDLILIPYELEKGISLKQVLKKGKPNSIGIFIGPEGGFDNDEIQLAVNSKADIVTLGNRILRTETTALVVLGIILYEYDQM